MTDTTKVSEVTNGLIAAIKKHDIEVVKTDKGVTIEVPKEVYLATLPEGITAESVKAHTGHDQAFTAAVVSVIGQKSNEYAKANKDVDTITGKVTFDTQRRGLNTKWQRTVETSAPGDRDNKIVKHGQMTVGFYTAADNHKAGDLKVVTGEIRAQAEEWFGDK